MASGSNLEVDGRGSMTTFFVLEAAIEGGLSETDFWHFWTKHFMSVGV